MSPFFERILRRYIRARLAKSQPEDLARLGERRLLKVFRRAATLSPAYRELLAEAGVRTDEIRSPADFSARCPLLEKANTFRRFGIDKLLAGDVPVDKLASILTSSGHGAGGYAIGLSTRPQYKLTPAIIDMGLDLAFDIDRKRSLLINCLPMGVTFQSDVCCVANVSVREDMACALVNQAGPLFEQIILCGDPLFIKRLCDYSQTQGVDWGRHRVHAIVGEETFSEAFRNYFAGVLGNDPDDPASGLIGSSMGVGELGLNLFNETRETIALRRACARDKALLARLVGPEIAEKGPLPTFLAFNPMRTYVEILNPDAHGAGELVVTMLDAEIPIPLMRYKTGDRMQVLGRAALADAEKASGGRFRATALPVVALFGRSKDYLPGGRHVDHFKEGLYAEPALVRQCSGAFRLGGAGEGGGLGWEIQMARDATLAPEALEAALAKTLRADLLGEKGAIRCFAYDEFPYGQTVDYERKFVYWPG